ncbi:MAG: ABC transporter permease [Lachnospiraceae bacterium]
MKYFLKKTLSLVISIVVLTLLTFFAFELIPGSPALSILGTDATPERVAALEESMGLNNPLFERYIRWAVGIFSGSFGDSYTYDKPVTELLRDKFSVTAVLTGMSFLWIVLCSIPLGILAASKHNKAADYLITVSSQVAMAVPSFLMGFLFTFLFGIILKLFVPGQYVPASENLGKFLYYLIFPSIAIALPRIGQTVKLLRTSLLREMKALYVRTAYSRGNSKSRVLYVHVLKNAMVPVLTFLGMMLAEIVANSIIIERVFSIPGMGRLLVDSIGRRDYPVVEAIIVLIGVLVIVVNYLVDILYQKLDPRISVAADND